MSQRLSKKQKRKLRQDGIIDAEGKFRSQVFNVKPDIQPKTEAQEAAFDAFEDGYNLMLHGCAGTGKSFLALLFALKSVLDKNTPQTKVILIRSAVPSREQGFQPGTQRDKEAVYETPYPPICNQIIGRGDAYQILKQKGMLEFTSTSFLRSETFDNAYIIVDEAQNMTFQELDTIFTRAGNNSKFVICGDTKQTDLWKKHDQSGLSEFMKILDRLEAFDFIEFYPEDVVRSGLVRAYLIEKHKLGL